MEPQSKAAEQIHDLGEFFRQEVAPTHRAAGAVRVAEELTRRGMREAAVVAIEIACALMTRDPEPAEAWFVMQWEGEPPASRAPLAEFIKANQDDEPLCQWLARAKVGDELKTGGGAAPACTVRRVS